MSLQVTLISVDPRQQIFAIKALRSATGGSLKWAKRDVHDMVRGGFPTMVEIRGPQYLMELRENGWLVRVDAAETKGEK